MWNSADFRAFISENEYSILIDLYEILYLDSKTLILYKRIVR